jgi:glycosyltransferase involved in cell wall biosynthesis
VRIAQLIDSLNIGGAETLQLTYAQAAARQNLPATVISLRKRPESPLPAQIQQTGAKLIELDAPRLTDPNRFLQLLRTLRREKIEVIHAHLTYAILLGGLASRLTGIPIVASIHNTTSDRFGRAENFFLRHFTDHVIAVGTAVAATYQPILGKKTITTLPNPVAALPSLPVEEQTRLRATLMSGDPSRPMLLSVGRLEPQKGLHDLLQAASLVRQHIPNVFFAIAGTGSQHPQLQAQISKLGLEQTVELRGPRSDIPALLAACDAFVIASHWEGLPIALLEAMSAGRPIIATRVGDIPNVLNSQTGLLVAPQEPQQLAAAIRQMLDNLPQAKQMGQAARQYVQQHHSPEAWLKQLNQIYAQTVRPNNKKTTHET